MESMTAIVTAIALGAAAGLQATTAQGIKDGYAALKSLIVARFPKIKPGIDHLEQAPDSKPRRSVVAEDLSKEGADQDTDVLQCAQALLKLIEQHAPHAGDAIGVELEDIKAASLHINDVISSGTGVKGKKIHVEGDITIKKVRAGQSPAEE